MEDNISLFNDDEKNAIETMKHWVQYEKEHKTEINNAEELITMQEIILNLIDKQDKHIKDFYTGELYTAKQLKNMENIREQHYIHRNIVKDFVKRLRLLQSFYDKNEEHEWGEYNRYEMYEGFIEDVEKYVLRENIDE